MSTFYMETYTRYRWAICFTTKAQILKYIQKFFNGFIHGGDHTNPGHSFDPTTRRIIITTFGGGVGAGLGLTSWGAELWANEEIIYTRRLRETKIGMMMTVKI